MDIGFPSSGVGQVTPLSSLLRTRTALARVISGTGNAYIACLGDSNTRGTGSSTTAAQQGYNGWPVKLAARLKARGINAVCDNFFGTGGQSGNYASYDDRIVLSRSAIAPATLADLQGVGGSWFKMNQSGDTMTIPNKSPANTCDIYWYSSSTSNQFSWAVDGGSATTITGSPGINNISKVTIPLGAVGNHSVVAAWVAGTAYILGMDFYDNTTNRVHVLNWGWHGSRTDYWTTGGQAGGQGWTAPISIPGFFKPDLIIDALTGTNDAGNAISDATFTTNKLAMIAYETAASDLILMTPGPVGTGFAGYADLPNKIAIIRALGGTYPLADEFLWMGGNEAAAEALGLYLASDHLHKTGPGHAVTAKQIDAFLGMLA